MAKFSVININNGRAMIIRAKSEKAIKCRLPHRGMDFLIQPLAGEPIKNKKEGTRNSGK